MKESQKIHSIYDRQKSGYRREFNPLDVFLFNVMGFALGLALTTNPAFIGSFAPNSDILWVIILGTILAFANGLIYGWFGAIMPSTGGDFVFVSRSLSHRLGFLTSWGFTFCQLYGFAMNVGWILTMAVLPSLITIGYSLQNQALISFATSLSENYVLFGSLVIIIFYWIFAILGFKLNRLLSRFLFVLGILGPLLIGWILFSHTHKEFVDSFNTFMQSINSNPDTYSSLINSAKSNGLVINSNAVISDTFKALPLGFLCFLGFTYSVYIGGEVEEPEKSQMKGIMGALLLGVVIFLLCMGRYVDVVGKEFHGSIGNFDLVSQQHIPGISMNFIAGILTDNPVVNILMQLGNLIWFLLVPYVMMQVCTRNIIAWTCDGLFPDKLLKRTHKFNSPINVITIVSLIGMLFVLLNTFFGISLIGAIALAAIAFFFTSLGALLLKSRNLEAYSKLPASAKKSFLGLSTRFQVFGFIGLMGFGWVTYSSLIYPEISGGTPGKAFLIVIVIYVLGLVVYEWRKNVLKRKEELANIDFKKLFLEIPED